MKTIPTISVQAKRIDEPDDAWKVRNALRDLNAALISEQITEHKAIDEANKVMNSWHINYHQEHMMLRVHVEHHKNRRRH